MLRSLGQNPTEEELKELIASVDDGDDADGQLQLREFLKLYTQGLDSKAKGKAGKDDVNNVFAALGGDPRDEASKVLRDDFIKTMMEQYDLELDLDSAFGKSGDSLNKGDFEAFLIPNKEEEQLSVPR